jgi:glycolate oxidase FAD binding subunit
VEEKTFADELSSILGKTKVLTGEKAADYALDGRTPAAVALPRTAEEVSKVLSFANERRLAVNTWGAGTKQFVGPPPKKVDLVLCTQKLNKVVAIEADDLLVRVQAGLPLVALEKILAERSFFVPLDPFGADATIGGILAANAGGPRRYRYRTARDLVLGMQVVLADGEIIKLGGTTVKNVAGYDLRKLFIGSWGTLGVITEVNLRLWPLPANRATLLGTFASARDAGSFVTTLSSSQLLPSSIELLDAAASRAIPQAKSICGETDEWLFIVVLEGHAADLERQSRDIREMAKKAGASHAIEVGEGQEEVWVTRRKLHNALAKQWGLRIKASLPLAKTMEFISEAESLARLQRIPLGVTAHAGNGIVYLSATAEIPPADQLMKPLLRLKDLAERSGGYLIVEVGPAELKTSPDLVPRRNDYGLMKRIKAQFDPNAILNQGRLIGGV